MLICVGILRLFEVTLFKGSRSKYQSGNYYEIIQVDESLVMHGEGFVDPDAKMMPLQVTERRNKIMYYLKLTQNQLQDLAHSVPDLEHHFRRHEVNAVCNSGCS